MNKVGIITYHSGHNYGAALQAYALNMTLISLGYNAEIINFRHPSIVKAHALFKPWTSMRLILGNMFTILRYNKVSTRWNRFEEFMKQFMVLSSKGYSSHAEIAADPPQYDAYICGSDQIWHPESRLDETYFLRFAVEKGIKTIAYAPSFGITTVPSNRREILSDYIADISYLSVRESAGRSIIKELTGRDAEVLIDPSLLLTSEQWQAIAVKPKIDKPYILVYCLDNSTLFMDVIRMIKNKTGLPVVVLAFGPVSRVKYADLTVYDAGPLEFLGLISNAEIVVTNSFHGMAFSVIFQKPFFTVPHSKTNSRLSDLLNKLSLSEHQIIDLQQIPDELFHVDFRTAMPLLEREREKAIRYLYIALG